MSVLDSQQEQIRPLIMGDPPNPFVHIAGHRQLIRDLNECAQKTRRDEIDRVLACQDIEELRKMLLYKLAGA